MKVKHFLPYLSIIAFFAVFFFSKASYAGEPPKLNLSGIIEEALRNNPQIQAAKSRFEASKAKVKLLRTLQDPRLEYEYNKIFPNMISGVTGEHMAPMRMFSVSQEIPFPTKLFLRKSAAGKEANAYDQEYNETKNKIIKEVKETYSQLFLNYKKIQIIKEDLVLLSQFIEVINKKYSVNKANQQDSLKAQVEYSKFSNQLVLLQQEKEIIEARLNALLNRPIDAPVGGVVESEIKDSDLNEEKIFKLAKDNRPELKSFKEIQRKSEIDYSLAKQEYLPDFMVKYTRQEDEGGMGTWSGMLGVSIPLWFWEKQSSFVKEAKANLEVADAQYRDEENMVLFEVRSALAEFNAAKKLVDIYETGVLPQAQAAVLTARRGFEADKISFLDLLDALRTLKDFQIEYFEARADKEIAMADLERTIGIELK